MALETLRVVGGPGLGIDVVRDTVTFEVKRLVWTNSAGVRVRLTIRRQGASRTFDAGTSSGQVNVPAGYTWDELATGAGLDVGVRY